MKDDDLCTITPTGLRIPNWQDGKTKSSPIRVEDAEHSRSQYEARITHQNGAPIEIRYTHSPGQPPQWFLLVGNDFMPAEMTADLRDAVKHIMAYCLSFGMEWGPAPKRRKRKARKTRRK